MLPDDRDAAYLWDMRQAASDAVRFLGDLDLQAFLGARGEVLRPAIERKLEVLGEAARRLGEPFRQTHPEVPWKDVIGLRNVISHQYDKLNYAEVYRIVHDRLPALIRALEPLVPPPPEA